jgi:hypothetical protein
MGSIDLEKEDLEFLKKDYELKVNYVLAQFSRMWMRFNFFLTIESALSVALFGLFKDAKSLSDYGIFIALIGAVSSLCWYAFGAQDRYLSAIYRKHIETVAAQLDERLRLKEYLKADYIHVGDQNTKIDQHIYQCNVISRTKNLQPGFFCFYILAISNILIRTIDYIN